MEYRGHVDEMKSIRTFELIRISVLTLQALLIIVLLFYQNARGQGIVSEEKRWNVGGYDLWGAGTETYIIEQDSILNGKIYKMIWQTFDSIDADWTYQGLLREESDKVYYVPPGAPEGLLYDFTLEAEDTAWIINMFCTHEAIPAIITEVDSMDYMGTTRKRWHIQSGLSDFNEIWIEGIGSNMGILHSIFYHCIACPWWDLLCCHNADTLIYKPFESCWVDDVGLKDNIEETNILIYPNPAKDKFRVRSAEFEVEKLEIYDNIGRRVLEKKPTNGHSAFKVDISQLKSGMYYCCFINSKQTISRKLLKH